MRFSENEPNELSLTQYISGDLKDINKLINELKEHLKSSV